MEKIKKSYAITDAKISFVSLVDKAANKKQFLITKAETKDERGFATIGKIVKADDNLHHVTGIVYEPMVSDAHDNFMTEDEIQKAAYWYAKNGDKVDLQHNFEECDACTVVETWVAKADFKIGDEPIKKGTWLMTVEVSDDNIWKSIEKGEITGFSMGGVGKYSAEDVNLKKGAESNTEDTEKKGIFKQFAEFMGFNIVEKGYVKDEYNDRAKNSNFWNAINTLSDLLAKRHYDNFKDRYVYDFENDQTAIKAALEDFNEIITEILTKNNVAKALLDTAPKEAIEKAGKKMSGKNRQMLTEITEKLNAFVAEFNEETKEEEDKEVTKEEIKKMIDESIQKAFNKGSKEKEVEKSEELTLDTVKQMIDEAITKASANHEEGQEEETLDDTINTAVTKAVNDILKAKGIPSNLNDEQNVEKQNDTHYLHGIL